MASVGKLLANRIPVNLTNRWLYKRNEHHPFALYVRQQGKQHLTKPMNRFKPYALYLHPYLPREEVKRVEIVSHSLPFCSYGDTYSISDKYGEPIAIISHRRFAVSVNDIYFYPTLFKPIYAFQLDPFYKMQLPFQPEKQVQDRIAIRANKK